MKRAHETPSQRALADKIRRARTPSADNTAAIEWARENGFDPTEAAEFFSERAGLHVYDGNTLAEAEEMAMRDTREFFERYRR